jgi:tetratricopeptide (TPR) repeat protein
MKIPTFQFPHISRFISASTLSSFLYWTERAVLWSLLIGLFSYNVMSTLAWKSPLTLYFLPALKEPFSSTTHMEIASKLWETGLHAQAKQEIALAQELMSSKDMSVLGMSTSPASLLQEWESQPHKREEEYRYWKTILEQKPDYRDAYIQAAVFAYELGNIEIASDLLHKAYTLDPTFHSTTLLLSRLEQ